MKSIYEILPLEVRVKLTDIGANPIDGAPPYAPLLKKGKADVVGFEPNPEALAELNKQKGPNETYLPHAVGDGKRHTLRFCFAPGMTSLLEPNKPVLGMFHGFTKWGEVTGRQELETRRLDDIPETKGVDYIKIDIQGGELMVFQNATERLKDALIIHTEVEFLPMYENQPLFTDVDLFLRQYGFRLHKFDSLRSRALQPLVVNNSPFSDFNQLFWADALFIRDIVDMSGMKDEQLLKLAVILHECYASVDVSLRLLGEYDKRKGTTYAPVYFAGLTGGQANAA